MQHDFPKRLNELRFAIDKVIFASEAGIIDARLQIHWADELLDEIAYARRPGQKVKAA